MLSQGEHGTGRNVAPYVEMEWGTKAYDLMWEIKEMFDPDYVLNPGVVLNRVRPCCQSCKDQTLISQLGIALAGKHLQRTVVALLVCCWPQSHCNMPGPKICCSAQVLLAHGAEDDCAACRTPTCT